MIVNIGLIALGAWGCYYTWTRRGASSVNPFFDFASSLRNPTAYKFAISIRLMIFGLCLFVGAYRAIFHIVD